MKDAYQAVRYTAQESVILTVKLAGCYHYQPITITRRTATHAKVCLCYLFTM